MNRPAAAALKLASAYVLIGALWILGSDHALEALAGSPARAQSWQVYKGWAFVGISGCLLFAFAKRQFFTHARLDQERIAQQQRYESLLGGVLDYGVFSVDRDGRVSAWNTGAEAITGWTEQEVLGVHLARLLAPPRDSDGTSERTLREAVVAGAATIECQAVQKNGENYWARLRIRPLKERVTGHAGFACILQDETAQKRAGTALSDSERIFRALFERAAIGIAQVSPDGRMLRVNQHYCSLLGRTEHELQRTSFADFTHPDDLDADLRLVSRCLTGEIDRYSMEKRYVRADGRIVWVNLFVALVRDAQQRPAFFVSVATDISWRKAAEEALADSRQRLQAAVAIARVGFWEYSLETRRMYFSHEAIAQLGMRDGELSDDLEEYRVRAHPDDRERLEAMSNDLVSGKQESAEAEFRFVHKNGSYRDIHFRAMLLRDRAGRPSRLLGTTVDLTPTRDSERLVRRLSARILHLQDTERRRIARHLHDSTAQILAALSMNLARLRRMLAKPDSNPLPTVEECNVLTENCVQEIRTLAYLLHPPLLDEFGLERATMDYVQGFARRSGIETSVVIEGQIERLPDEIELSVFRVLQESLANVVRHSGSAQARVTLRRKANTLELAIEDFGTGIPATELEKLNSGAPLGVGVTGMRERLEHIGGRLEIDSSAGGTTVRVIVPVSPKN